MKQNRADKSASTP